MQKYICGLANQSYLVDSSLLDAEVPSNNQVTFIYLKPAQELDKTLVSKFHSNERTRVFQYSRDKLAYFTSLPSQKLGVNPLLYQYQNEQWFSTQPTI